MSNFQPSPFQEAIFRWIKQGRGDAIVNAVAGSGKTTTLVQAAMHLRSRDAVFCAFNAHIAKELGIKLNGQMECKTIHSIGYAAIARQMGNGKIEVDGNKYAKLARREARALAGEIMTVRESEIRECLSELVNYSQVALTDPTQESDLLRVIGRYSINIPKGLPFHHAAEAVNRILLAGQDIAKNERTISFTDMIWLPAVWDLKPRTAQWVFVDECQDLSAAQLELVLKMRAPGGRMIFVGDPRQAIYGFAGADAESYWNIKARTAATEFPLSVCYRCPVLVVREAGRIVPQIEPKPNAELGVVRWSSESKIHREIREGDLILCRMTAPLVKLCLELIAQRVPARVRGRDIGKQLTATVKAVADHAGFELASFIEYLNTWTDKQVKTLSQREDTEAQIEAVRDKRDALVACFDSIEARTLEDFICGIESLFDDNRPGVWLSTVHKAKGLEESRVFILKPDKLPLVWKGQQEWEFEQEVNLRYVAITRATQELVYVQE